MASEERKAADNKIKQENFFASLGAAEQQAETDAFQCSRCKQRKCRYRQAQTRSADEPMTVRLLVARRFHMLILRLFSLLDFRHVRPPTFKEEGSNFTNLLSRCVNCGNRQAFFSFVPLNFPYTVFHRWKFS